MHEGMWGWLAGRGSQGPAGHAGPGKDGEALGFSQACVCVKRAAGV